MNIKDVINFILPYINKEKKHVFLFLILSISVSLLQAIPAEITKLIFDVGFAKKNYEYILILSITLVVLYITKSIISYFFNKKIAILGQNIIKRIRREYFKYVINSDYGFYTDKDSVYINERFNEINNISGIFSSGMWDIIISTIQAAFVLIILMKINHILTIIMIIPIPIIYLFSKIYVSKIASSSNFFLEQSSVNKSKMNEKITAIELIKLSGTEEEEETKMTGYDEKMFDSQLKLTLLTRKFIETISVYVSLIPVILYCVGGRFFINDTITIGGIIVFSTYIGKVYTPFISISTLSLNLATVKTSIGRLKDFFGQDHYKNNAKNNDQFDGKVKNIRFENVYFKYNSIENPVIKNLSFQLEGSGIYQICGENGSGKSTIVKLLCGLLKDYEGGIFYNNYSIKTIAKDDIRKIVSVMSQNVFLFDDTLENNILYGNKNIEKEKYSKICSLLNIDEIFTSRGMTKEMMVGSGGIKLSGGEKQKIALARTMLKDTDVIIFDEALSNIDIETKKLIKYVICEELTDKLIIIIDHSDFFSDVANKIVKLDTKM
ncbi:TPA: ABC transporter ATP-binding protein [Streptococcus pyogenes]|nr:ABC transporter ATP-binding protein [Streptococcus pyogenes]HES4526843.1 ABC transporter ATP-binding protein [Streptococcus pyogenes]